METLLQMLNGIHPLSAELQTHLKIILKTKKLKKREYHLKKGHVCSTIAFIGQGLLHCYTEESIKFTSWLMKEGNVIISVKSFFEQVPSHEYIQAIEDSELFYITYSELQDTYRMYPEFETVGRKLTERYYILENELRTQIQKAALQERLNWFQQKFPGLIARVPARHIASFLGVREETLSRNRSFRKNLDKGQTELPC